MLVVEKTMNNNRLSVSLVF